MNSAKEIILKELKKNKGIYISGENLCTGLGISRTAVFKHIRSLKKLGYSIVSQKRLGYCLTEIPDILVPSEIKEGLKTRYIGKNIYHFNNIVSTNDYAKIIAARGVEDGTIVIACTQSSGRGRLGRNWASPSGGIWFSVILYPEIEPHNAPKMTMISALSVTQALKKVTGLDVKIKWPNDILVGLKQQGSRKVLFRKICGILTEMNAEMDKVNWIVIGIGVNVNNRIPVNLQSTACSLASVIGGELSKVRILQEILRALEYNYTEFVTKGFDSILKGYKQHAAFLGKNVRVDYMGKHIWGTAVDIDCDGTLIIRSRSKKLKIIAGDIAFL